MAFVIPTPTVDKTVNKEYIYPGETFTVTITITGAEVVQGERVPTAVVFVLDESNSMEIDNRYQSSRAAATALTQLLAAGSDKAALITFSTNATLRTALTTTTNDVVQAIQNLGEPDGMTNMAAGLEMALDQLVGDDTPNKIIILFTDGYPEPLAVDQINQIVGPLTEQAINLGAQIFPVTLSAEQEWLEDVADETFGSYENTEDIDQLEVIFQAAFGEVSNVLSTRNLVLTEELAPDFEYIANSLNFSFSGPGETAQFAAEVAASEANFGATNSITLPSIPFLPQDRIFTVTFEATSTNCLTPFSQELEVILDVDSIPPSAVAYTAEGNGTHTVALPQRQIICKRPGDLIFEKSFDEVNHIVNLTLTNAYQDRTITDIEIYEAVTEYFEALIVTANPALDGQAIITSSTPHIRFFYWRLDDLGPLESRSFEFEVRVLACAPDQSPPLPLNLVIPPLVEAIPCLRGSHINYVVPTGEAQPFESETKRITYLEEPRLDLQTSGAFELPPCPTEPGSLAGTVGSGGMKCPEEVLDTSNLHCMVCEAVHDRLFWIDPSDGILPGLAEGFELSEDLLEYVIELKPDVTFHDGTRLSSRLVMHNLSRTMELIPGFIRPSLVTIGKVKAVRAIDENRILVRLNLPDPEFIRTLSGNLGIIAVPSQAAGMPIGAGPYRLLDLNAKQAALRRFGSYWQGRAKIEQLIYYTIADETDRLRALLAGTIDIMTGQVSMIYERLSQSAGFTVCGSPENFRAASERVKEFECLPNLDMQLRTVEGVDPLRIGLLSTWYVNSYKDD